MEFNIKDNKTVRYWPEVNFKVSTERVSKDFAEVSVEIGKQVTKNVVVKAPIDVEPATDDESSEIEQVVQELKEVVSSVEIIDMLIQLPESYTFQVPAKQLADLEYILDTIAPVIMFVEENDTEAAKLSFSQECMHNAVSLFRFCTEFKDFIEAGNIDISYDKDKPLSMLVCFLTLKDNCPEELKAMVTTEHPEEIDKGELLVILQFDMTEYTRFKEILLNLTKETTLTVTLDSEIEELLLEAEKEKEINESYSRPIL